ncbi:endonuclease Q family protein [Bacillus shivajii]|uniref:endonuclease Q family protein n=1 Tax=Bacillus shivajii TaxID=1983719 RepID=UPI001CF9A429|nr:endonuclease Q family protein [Bacillus shivajii]UCZ54687.1 endonuclease Q family protein [Bacillus shivajii]
MKTYYMDLHVHIGRTFNGNAVKITASDKLTLTNILEESITRKGIDIIGIIDAQSPEVLEEMSELIDAGYAYELAGGGIRYKEQVTLILGAELEIYDEYSSGPIHVLCYFPTVNDMADFSAWCQTYLKNIQLSSQRLYCSGIELQTKVKEHHGWFIPAHVFTPFKSMYGKGVKVSLTEVFDHSMIDAVELGLSSDTYMADELIELTQFPYLSNSDAHSLQKLGREHQLIRSSSSSFEAIKKAIDGRENHRIVKNVGLNPRLGKYYSTTCKVCSTPLKNEKCPNGHTSGTIKGVSERITELSDLQRFSIDSSKLKKCIQRPPYKHQVPLEFIPGCGPKTVNKLIQAFHSEMAVLHEVPIEQLIEVIPQKIANDILNARAGTLAFVEGGGGTYGKIKK